MVGRDIRSFAAHAGFPAAVAVLASSLALALEVAATAAVPAIWGPGGPVYLAAAIGAIGALDSRRFTGRWLALDEWFGAVLATAGAVLATREVVPLASGDAPAVARSVLFLVGVQVALLVAFEFAVWRVAARARVRATYRYMWRATHGRTAADPRLGQDIRSRLRLLSRQSTAATAPLCGAVAAWYGRWLLAPEGMSGPDAEALAQRIDEEMALLFGRPVQHDGQ